MLDAWKIESRAAEERDGFGLAFAEIARSQLAICVET